MQAEFAALVAEHPGQMAEIRALTGIHPDTLDAARRLRFAPFDMPHDGRMAEKSDSPVKPHQLLDIRFGPRRLASPAPQGDPSRPASPAPQDEGEDDA
jgi:hypothetical protein